MFVSMPTMLMPVFFFMIVIVVIVTVMGMFIMVVLKCGVIVRNLVFMNVAMPIMIVVVVLTALVFVHMVSPSEMVGEKSSYLYYIRQTVILVL